MKPELIEYAISEGKETIAFHLKNMDELCRESNTTLSFLITAGGASLAGCINFLKDEKLIFLSLPLLMLSGYYFVLSFLLVSKCLKARENYSPANEPKNLYQPDYSLEAIKEAELENLNERILLNRDRNAVTGLWLSRVRYAFFLSPVFFVISLLAVWALGWVMGFQMVLGMI